MSFYTARVKTGKSRSEQLFSDLPPEADLTADGRLTVPMPDISRTGSAADQIRVCSQTLKSAKAVVVVVARLQRHHPHPEHCLVADIDIVLARECQLAVIANTEHRQARGYCLYRIAIPHIHRQIVLRHQ